MYTVTPSSSLFSMANVLVFIWRKKKKIISSANVACGDVYQACQFYSSQDVIVKKRRLRREWFSGLVFYATPLSISHVTFRLEQFYPEQWESKNLIFPPMPLAEDHEHSSLLFLCFGFLSLRDLWEQILKTVFCISSSGTRYADIPLNMSPKYPCAIYNHDVIWLSFP